MANYNIVNIAALHPISTLDEKDETHNINGKAVGDYVDGNHFIKCEDAKEIRIFTSADDIPPLDEREDDVLYIAKADDVSSKLFAEMNSLKEEIESLKQQLSNYVTLSELKEKKYVSSNDTSLIRIVNTTPEDDGSDSLIFVTKKD